MKLANYTSQVNYDDDISLLTHDKRKCYSTVKHCKPNTVNEKKSNQRKQNKLRGIKEDRRQKKIITH